MRAKIGAWHWATPPSFDEKIGSSDLHLVTTDAKNIDPFQTETFSDKVQGLGQMMKNKRKRRTNQHRYEKTHEMVMFNPSYLT